MICTRVCAHVYIRGLRRPFHISPPPLQKSTHSSTDHPTAGILHDRSFLRTVAWPCWRKRALDPAWPALPSDASRAACALWSAHGNRATAQTTQQGQRRADWGARQG